MEIESFLQSFISSLILSRNKGSLLKMEIESVLENILALLFILKQRESPENGD